MAKKILGIMGSYRKGGVVDSLVTEVLRAAESAGAETEKIDLLDQEIEFCSNCRKCTQSPGFEPGACVHDDAMAGILKRCLAADGLVLGAPVNFYNVNALTRRFMERFVCLAYWPWESHGGPKMRITTRDKKAVLITSAAMPAFLVPFATGALRALKITANTLGARPVATIVAGLAGDKAQPQVSESLLRRAQAAGRKLAAG